MPLSKLQKEAKSLGLKYIAVPLEELEIAVAEAKAGKGSDSVDSTPEVEPVEVSKEEFNTVIVLNKNNNEIRRYTAEDHGKDFVKLAESFSGKDSDYTLVYKQVRPAILCPQCGGKIYRD